MTLPTEPFFEGLDKLKAKIKPKEASRPAEAVLRPAGERVLYDVIRQINYYTLNFAETLARIVASSVRLAGAERGALFSYDAAGELTFSAGEHLDPPRLGEAEREAILEVARQASRGEGPRTGLLEVAGRAYLCVPLRVDATGGDRPGQVERRTHYLPLSRVVLGVLYIDGPASARGELEELLGVYEVLGQQATTALVNAQCYAQATTDPLTGLYNRSYLAHCLENERQVAEDAGLPFSVLMLDLDFFKVINDRYGHVIGDEVLVQLAGILRTSVREHDCLARYGGEEFVVLLPQTDIEHGRVVAEKVRSAVERASFTAEDISITVSIGLAAYPAHAASVEELIRRADQALYEAKHGGKNRAVIWHPDMGDFSRRADALAGIVVGDTARDYQNIQRLLEAITIVNSTIALDDLMTLVVDMMLEITSAERGILMLANQRGELEARIARDAEARTVQKVTYFSNSIPRKVYATGQPVWILDTMSEDNLDAKTSSIADLQLRTVMCVPLEAQDRIIGVIYVDSHSATKAFNESNFTFFYALARQVSVAIETARLIDENVKQRTRIEDLNRQLAARLERTEQELEAVTEELAANRQQIQLKYNYDQIVGHSPRMQEIFQLLDKVTDSDVPVLIMGENGTGKELIAKAIHYNGPLRNRRIVSENCGAIAETLLESELFGHIRGAFSGAESDKKGLFEQADGGTLFLDEIGEMALDMQKKLLRVLQEGEIRPVGSNEVRAVRVRLICATNRDLKDMVRKGEFREDLYYRINVVSVKLPSLRERPDDVPSLVERFLDQYAQESGQKLTLEPEALKLLARHEWPGNVRELQNQIRKACALAQAGRITSDLFADLSPSGPVAQAGAWRPCPLKDVERDHILRTLEAVQWNKVEAAKVLKIDRTTLYNKIDKYDLKKDGET